MSVLEQLLFAVVGVTILAANLALSDPFRPGDKSHRGRQHLLAAIVQSVMRRNLLASRAPS
jgi:hypothetical protein